VFVDMGSLQDMNHVDLMRPITKWSVSVPTAKRLGEYVATAFRKATTNVPGPVFLEMPLDLLFEQVDENEAVFPTQYRTDAGIAGDPRAVERAFALLKSAERPMAIVGSQYWWSKRREAYPNFVETFGMPVYVNGAARGSLPPGHPYFFQQTRKEALKSSDVILIFGTPLDFRIGYGRESHINPKAKLIHVDLDGNEPGRNRGCEVGIIGDTGLVMEQLTELAESEGYSKALAQPWVRDLRGREEDKWQKMQPGMNSDADPIDPLRACKEIDSIVDDDTIIVGDGGDFVGTAAYTVRPRRPGQWLDPGPLGTLGVGPGYAMAAKLARPNSNVIILYGDGAFGLHAMEFEAMVRQKINVVGIVGNDAGWSQILRGQEQLYGPDRTPATKLLHTRYDRVVEALGGHGEHVEKAADIRPALERALAAGKPALVNIKLGRSDFRKDAISV
jgi:acetolactate synthase-1/2/3 large subunit